MKHVLVTGANGHVGYNLTKLLATKGYQVRATVRNPNNAKPLKDLGVEVVEVDIMRPETILPAMESIDGLFQVAAVFKMIAKNPQREIIDPSVKGGINVLEAAKKAGVKKIVFTSSTAAVGTSKSSQQILTEDNWNDTTKNPYRLAKTLAEKKAWEYAKEHNLNMVTMCPSVIIGPGFFRHTPSTALYEKVLCSKLPIILPFNFALVDARDVAMAHLLAYENEEAKGRYIITDKYVSMKQLMTEIKKADPSLTVPSKSISASLMPFMPIMDWFASKLTGRARQITWNMATEFAGKEQRLSTDKIRNELGWRPMEFQRCLKDTLKWTKENFIDKG